MSVLLKSMSPLSKLNSLTSNLAHVDLPLPICPTNATVSPGFIVKFKLFNMYLLGM